METMFGTPRRRRSLPTRMRKIDASARIEQDPFRVQALALARSATATRALADFAAGVNHSLPGHIVGGVQSRHRVTNHARSRT